MDVRSSATALSDAERDRFLEAVIRLEHQPAPDGSGVSVYDQYVALHGAVMAVLAPGPAPGETVNFGHWNIGVCAWHRQCLRSFERQLQARVAGVAIPYWDWTDHVDAVNSLFTPDFLGSLREGGPGPVPDGVLCEGLGAGLSRGSVGVGWPPTQAGVDRLEQLVMDRPGVHPLGYFWLVLEQGHPQVTGRTHTSGHNFIGGHVSGALSPNDPGFWLHHSNVDRLWANWRANRLAAVPGCTPGHRLGDTMGPWVGGAPGLDVAVSPAVTALLPDLSDAPAVTVGEVLDTTTLDVTGYEYAPPPEPRPAEGRGGHRPHRSLRLPFNPRRWEPHGYALTGGSRSPVTGHGPSELVRVMIHTGGPGVLTTASTAKPRRR